MPLSLNCTCVFSPPGVAAADELTVIAPLEAEVIVMLLPAIRYDDPSTSRVRDPLNPALNLAAPVKVDPLTVATTESLIFSVTSPETPPPVNPVPALTAVMSPPPVEDIVT